MTPLEIRLFRENDRPALYDICLRTGDHGQDASAACSHPDLLGDYFAVPYMVRDPSLGLILEDDHGPCGYILGTTDTRAFAAWFNQSWLPDLRQKYGDLAVNTTACDAWLFDELRNDMPVPDWANKYPAHLHIDLLPKAQRRGAGRRLFRAWLALATSRGAYGLHLGVSRANPGAIAFYERMGMQRIAATTGAWIYGLQLSEQQS